MNLVFNRATILFELTKRLIVEFSFLNFIFVKKFSSFPPKKKFDSQRRQEFAIRVSKFINRDLEGKERFVG